MVWIILVYSLVSFLLGYFSVLWHKTREQEKALQTAGVGLVMDVLNDIPIIVLVMTRTVGLLIAGYAGVAIGTYAAIRRHKSVIGGHGDGGLQSKEAESGGQRQAVVRDICLERVNSGYFVNGVYYSRPIVTGTFYIGEPEDT